MRPVAPRVNAWIGDRGLEQGLFSRAGGASYLNGPGLLATKRETGMKPRITLVTLGVDDLERALRFYRDGLGFPTKGIVGTEHENGAVVFIEMQKGLGLALWPRKSIAADS